MKLFFPLSAFVVVVIHSLRYKKKSQRAQLFFLSQRAQLCLLLSFSFPHSAARSLVRFRERERDTDSIDTGRRKKNDDVKMKDGGREEDTLNRNLTDYIQHSTTTSRSSPAHSPDERCWDRTAVIVANKSFVAFTLNAFPGNALGNHAASESSPTARRQACTLLERWRVRRTSSSLIS
jgi:hypothetical protein